MAAWPFRRTLALAVAVFVVSFVVSLGAMLWDDRPRGYAKPAQVEMLSH